MKYKVPPDPTYSIIKIDDDFSAIVDPWNYAWLRQYPWKVYRHQRCYYAKFTLTVAGKQRTIYMHRLVALTPSGETCHHRNRQTLDNRRGNLLNMTKLAHRLLHQNDSLLIKFAELGPETVIRPAFFGL